MMQLSLTIGVSGTIPPIVLDARLARKGPGKEAKLSYAGHVLLDNRHGLVANVCATAATGTAEREAALLLLGALRPGGTVGGDKGFDVPSFVAGVRELTITPHVAQKVKGTAIDGRTTRHAGYAISQQKRKLIEQVFGWNDNRGRVAEAAAGLFRRSEVTPNSLLVARMATRA